MSLIYLTYQLVIAAYAQADTSLLWSLTYIFFGLAFFYLVFIFFIKRKFSNKELKKSSKRSELAPIISNFLFYSPKDSIDEQKEYVTLKIEIREYLRDKTFRKILAEILFDLQKDVSGSTEERLFRLYRELDLHHDAFAKLESWRWELVSQGILELTQMQVSESYQLIIKFINDKRSTIRKQAEIATIKLRKEGLAYILDTTTYAISEWQQLKMIEASGEIKDYMPPKFKAWLVSENNDVVLFALRLIKHYNQNEAAASIIELVKHKEDQIKLEAIQCIKDFNFKESKATLRSAFSSSSDEVKIQILSAIALFGHVLDIPFLNGVAAKTSNFLIATKANSAINHISPETILPTKDIGKTDTSDKEIELPLEEKPRIINDEENTTVIINEEFLEIETTHETDIFEIEEASPVKARDVVETKEENLDEPNFEFGVLDEVDNSKLDNELGLLSSTDDTIENDALNQELRHDYLDMSITNRASYIATVENHTEANQIETLEIIMELENDSELRFNAFKKLQDLKNETSAEPLQEVEFTALEKAEKIKETEEVYEKIEEKEIIKTNALDLNTGIESIFYLLYSRATDIDSKCILIKEMEAIGDEKEIVFLEFLKQDAKPIVSKAINKAIKEINTRIAHNYNEPTTTNSTYIDEAINHLMAEETVEIDTDTTSIDIQEEIVFETIDEAPEILFKDDAISTEEESKLPLDLCFLFNEFGIKAPKTKDSVFDFELSEGFFMNLKRDYNEH